MPKILVVEDNPDNADLLIRRLEKNGYSVKRADNGKTGIELAEEWQPHLILMDMSLPEIDGWDATRLLKSSGSTKHIPIIALTAHAMPGDEARARLAGCDEYEVKPIDFQRLQKKMDALL